jgi:hypothetical protein
MDKEEGLFGLVIIESLDENEEKTGTTLHSETIKYKQFQEPNLSSFLYCPKTSEEFFKVLDEIKEKIINENLFPLIHIECHGGEDGIQLASKEIVSWVDLFTKTTEINIELKNRLVLFLAMCSGIAIIGKVNPELRAPFKAIVGTTSIISPKDLLLKYEEFYNNFFFSFDIVGSVKEMNEVGDSKNTFHFITSEFCFDGIVNPDRDPLHFKRSVNQIAVQEKATNPIYKADTIEEVKKTIEADMRNTLNEIKSKKDFFIMTDLQ